MSLPFWLPDLQLQLQPETESQVPFHMWPVPHRGWTKRPRVGWRASLLQATLSSHPHKCWLCGMAGSSGAAISLCSEAAHLFPGIGLPAPTYPKSGNSLALGLWEKGTAWLPPSPEGGGRGCCCSNASRPPALKALAGQLLPTVLDTRGGGRLKGLLPQSTSAQPQSSHNTLLPSLFWPDWHPWLPGGWGKGVTFWV